MKVKTENKHDDDVVVKGWINEDGTTTRVHEIGNTNYIISSNYVPSKENKKRLEHTLKRIQAAQIEEYVDKYRQGKLDEIIADLETRV